MDFITAKIDDVKEAKNIDGFFEEVISPFSKLTDLIIVYLKQENQQNLINLKTVCTEKSARNIINKMTKLVTSDLLLHLTDVYAYSADSIESTQIILTSLSKTGIVIDSVCSFELKQNLNLDEFLENFKAIKYSIQNQKNKIKEIYFPDSVAYVVNQYLKQISSESYSFSSKEIKDYNQRVALELAKYLEEYYRGFDVYSVGINRAGLSLVGKLSSESVIEVTKNGWTAFVFRSPKASSYQNLTLASAVISKVIDDYQDSSTENALCEKGNPEKTASEVFKAIMKICGTVSLCAVLPFSNFGVAQVGNLQIEPYSLCNSMEFQGFHFIAGLNVDGLVDQEVDEPVDEANWEEFKEEFEAFLDNQEVKLEENKEEKKSENNSTIHPPMDLTTRPSTKSTTFHITAVVKTNKTETIHNLNYSKDLEHTPLEQPTPNPELLDVHSTEFPVKLTNVLYTEDNEKNVNFSMRFIPNYFVISFIVILKLL